RHTSFSRDWSSDVCSSDLIEAQGRAQRSFSEALINLQTAERLRLANLAERERVQAEIEKARTEQTILRYERRRIAHQQLAESRRSEERRGGKDDTSRRAVT